MFKVKAEKMRPRAGAPTGHGLPSMPETFRSGCQPLSAARQSQASCKPLSLAVKHGGTDVSMLVPIKSVNIDSFWCTGGGIRRQPYSHTLRRSNFPTFGILRQNQLCVFVLVMDVLHLQSQLSVRDGGKSQSDSEEAQTSHQRSQYKSVSFSLRQDIAAGTPKFSPVYVCFIICFCFFTASAPSQSMTLFAFQSKPNKWVNQTQQINEGKKKASTFLICTARQL